MPSRPESAWAQSTELAPYSKVSGLQGTLRVAGSEGHADVITMWADGFRSLYPAVSIRVEGGGSTGAPRAIRENTADFGIMSRPLRPADTATFSPAELSRLATVTVCADVLAVFVHKDNPVRGLSFPDLERIFGAAPRGGAVRARTWGELGVSGELAGKAINFFGRNPDAGSHAFLRAVVLGGGDYCAEAQSLVGPMSVVRAIALDPAGIGYAQLRTRVNKVRPLALGTGTDQPVEPTPEACATGRYPLVHPIQFIFDQAPEHPSARVRGEFIRFVLSKDGQEIARALGLTPLPLAAAREELAKLK